MYNVQPADQHRFSSVIKKENFWNTSPVHFSHNFLIKNACSLALPLTKTATSAAGNLHFPNDLFPPSQLSGASKAIAHPLEQTQRHQHVTSVKPTGDTKRTKRYENVKNHDESKNGASWMLDVDIDVMISNNIYKHHPMRIVGHIIISQKMGLLRRLGSQVSTQKGQLEEVPGVNIGDMCVCAWNI